jgi:UDP-N-acetylbacillosamine N-acetyltransferase
VIIESLLDAGYKIKGYFDFRKAERNPYGLEYFGYEGDADVKTIVGKDLVFPSIGENSIRKKLIGLFDNLELNQFVAIDPSTNISKTAKICRSTYIGKNVTINAQTEIGIGVILNTSCIVEHECKVSDYVHIAPGAVLCGNVNVGEESFVGANSVVKQNVEIEQGNFIGAGSVVIENLNEKGIWVGNPVKLKK